MLNAGACRAWTAKYDSCVLKTDLIYKTHLGIFLVTLKQKPVVQQVRRAMCEKMEMEMELKVRVGSR